MGIKGSTCIQQILSVQEYLESHIKIQDVANGSNTKIYLKGECTKLRDLLDAMVE